MDTISLPPSLSISSFVIRFVVNPGTQDYRGEIRHIQTQQELHFQSWEDAVKFIRVYVPIEPEPAQVTGPQPAADHEIPLPE
jgi:hypothetical protein